MSEEHRCAKDLEVYETWSRESGVWQLVPRPRPRQMWASRTLLQCTLDSGPTSQLPPRLPSLCLFKNIFNCLFLDTNGTPLHWKRKPTLRAGLHHRPWSSIMKSGLFQWFDLTVKLPWSDFLKNQFTKSLDPSVGVNRIWINMNDHASKSECFNFFNICSKKSNFGKFLRGWPSSSSSSSILSL